MISIVIIVIYAAVLIWCFVGVVKTRRVEGQIVVYYEPKEFSKFEKIDGLHISYNSLTHGRSKFKENGRFYLQGINARKIYKCEVSEDFWNSTEENTHYILNNCEEIKQ